MAVPLVDFHCHLDLYPDYIEEVLRCEREGIFTLTVTTTPQAWAHNHEITSATKHVRAALGLHPQLVAERAKEIDLWESLLPQARYVGEVGLDAGPRFYKSLDIQKVVFERVLKACAAAGDKILTVHSVRATTTVLDLIELHLPMTKGLVVLHWFTGTASEARRAVAMGCYFSINMQMLLDDKRRAIVTAIPLERLLTETDGPFTTTNSLPNRPEDVRSTIRELAAAFDKGESEMRLTIATNLGTVVAFGTCR